MVVSDSSSPSTTYFVCGLHVRSDRHIPDLIAIPVAAEFGSADVEITFQEHPESSRFERQTLRYSSNQVAPNGEPAVRLWEIASSSLCLLYQLVYGDGTKFVIDEAGSKVWASWASESTFEDTLTYLLGPVLGFVLRLRGVTCLHASAVAIDGVAVALAGPAGAGKSTTAAQFAGMGYQVLSDDIATLEPAAAAFLVQPSPARLRLWPASVEHLYGGPDALPRLTASWEKRYLDLQAGDRRLQSSPLPLAAIYVLSNPQSPAAEIEEIPRAEAMMQLLANVYVNYLLDGRFRERDFVRIAKVVNAVSVRRVNLRHDFAVLEQICRSIATDFSQARNLQGRVEADRAAPSSFVSCLD
jgi:hypothetical protein